MPTSISPCPSLTDILHPHHETTVPGHLPVYPFALHNRLGVARVCMPTIVSFPQSHAYRPKSSGKPGEGRLWNELLRRWEEPYLAEKEQMLVYRVGETVGVLATPTQRAVRLVRNGWQYYAVDGRIFACNSDLPIGFGPHQGTEQFLGGGK